MLTKDIYGKDLSTSFNSAISSSAQFVKPKIIINLLDSRHITLDGTITNNDAHSNTSEGSLGYFFSEKQAINGYERQTFKWAVTDVKQKNGDIIRADGTWVAMPSNLDDDYEMGWWTSSKSNSAGSFTTQPVLTIPIQQRKVNKIRVVTSEYYGQIKSFTIRVVNDTHGDLLNKTVTLGDDEYYKDIYIKSNTAITSDYNADRIILTLISTKNGSDYGRIQEICPYYEVDITDNVIDYSVNRTRDVHESSLPIGGSQSSGLNLRLDNTTKDWNIFSSSSKYGKYMKKDLKINVSTGWRIKKTEDVISSTSLRSSLSNTAISMSLIDTSIFPSGGSGNYFLVTVDPDNESREIILCKSTDDNVTVSIETRGFAGTDAVNHSSGAVVQFDPYEYVPMGQFYVNEWQVSSSDMTVNVTASDWTKFMDEKTLIKGFLLENVSAGECIENLLLQTNFPKGDIDYLDKYSVGAIKKSALASYSFKESLIDRDGSTVELKNGLRCRFWGMGEDNESNYKTIIADYYKNDLTNQEIIDGVKSTYPPTFYCNSTDAGINSTFSDSTHPNLLTNPSFETNTTGWTGINSTISRVSGTWGSGSFVLRSTSSSTGKNVALFESGLFQVTPGHIYTVSISGKYISGKCKKFKLQSNYYDSTGAPNPILIPSSVTYSRTFTIDSSNPVRMSVNILIGTVTLPSPDNSYLKVRVIADDTDSGDVSEWDAAMIQRDSLLNEFSSSSPWTANASVNLVNFKFTGNDLKTYSEYFNGVIDGYYIPPVYVKDFIIDIANGGVRMYLNDTLIIESWKDNAGSISLSAAAQIGNSLSIIDGVPQKIRIEFFHGQGVDNFSLALYRDDGTSNKTIVKNFETRSVVAKDSIGYLDSSFAKSSTNFNLHRLNGIYSVGSVLGNETSVSSESDDKSVYLSNGSYIRIPMQYSQYSSNSFTVESVVKFPVASYASNTVIRTNLIKNPSFEIDSSTWTISNANTSVTGVTSTESFYGSKSFFLRGNSAVATTITLGTSGTDTANIAPVVGDSQYSFSFAVKKGSVDVTIPSAKVLFYNSSGTLLSTFEEYFIPQSYWRTVGFLMTSPTNAAYARVSIQLVNVSNIEEIYIDGILFEKTDSTLPYNTETVTSPSVFNNYTTVSYFDGSYPGNSISSWTGTPHASTSTCPYIVGGEYIDCGGLKLFRSDDGYIGAQIYADAESGAEFVQVIGDDSVFNDNDFHHVLVSYNSSTKETFLYIDGVQEGYAKIVEELFSFSSDITIGGVGSDYYGGAEIAPSSTNDLYIDEFAIYKIYMPKVDAEKRFYSYKVNKIQIYPFLYGFNETIRSSVDNISFADLGRLYIDELNIARYENFYKFFETFIDQHANVQYEMNDSKEIISADFNVQLQANKVKIKVYSISNYKSALTSLWRPEEPSTLASVNLVSDFEMGDSQMIVSTTDDPVFSISGYLAIDDEIVKYNSKSTNVFLGIERAQFGTLEANHFANSKVREVRYYNINYDKSPAFSVRSPYVDAILFENPPLVDIFKFKNGPYTAELLIGASKNLPVDSIVYLEGTNPITELIYATSVAGIAVESSDSNQQIIEQVESLDDNIRRYGLKEITIDSPYITDVDFASTLAKFIIERNKEPVPIINVQIMSVPKLQNGDRVKITSFDAFDIIDDLNLIIDEYWVISQDFSYGSSISHSLILRKVV